MEAEETVLQKIRMELKLLRYLSQMNEEPWPQKKKPCWLSVKSLYGR